MFLWLTQNIESDLASNVTVYPIVKALWEALAVTYNNNKDKLQTFHLHANANEIKQNGVLLKISE